MGTVVAIWTAGYIVSCLLSQRIARRLSPRASVTIAIIGVGVFMFLFRFTWTVPQMSVLGLFYGLFLGGVWAPLMGWLSGDAEGVTLSRRLGFFNISWSVSVILAPLLASYLVKQSITLPFGVMTAIIAVAGLVVLTTRYRQPRPAALSAFPVVTSAAGNDSPPTELDRPVSPLIYEEMLPLDPVKMRYIRYLAWTGALVAYMAIAVFRYQMPHLAKTIHMDEVVFGRVAVSLSLAITIAFFVLARWTGWHGKTRWIFLPQILLVVASGLLTWATSAWAMVPLMLAAGFSAGLLYACSVLLRLAGRGPGRPHPPYGHPRDLPERRRDPGQLPGEPAQPAPRSQPGLPLPGGGRWLDGPAPGRRLEPAAGPPRPRCATGRPGHTPDRLGLNPALARQE